MSPNLVLVGLLLANHVEIISSAGLKTAPWESGLMKILKSRTSAPTESPTLGRAPAGMGPPKIPKGSDPVESPTSATTGSPTLATTGSPTSAPTGSPTLGSAPTKTAPPGSGPTGMMGPPPGSGSSSSGSSSQNPHVTDWGDYAICEAPPAGSCADYTITKAEVLASLSGFTTYDGATLTTTSMYYFGEWWDTNVGTSVDLSEDFCDDGQPGAGGGTGTLQSYTGVTFEATDSEFTLSSEGVPPSDIENYCSNVGGVTPPLMKSTFGESYSQSFTLSPSTKSREIISNQVGWAVDGVVIFSPYTGISTVAPYDESLDTCIGHPADGRYHYHGFSPCIHGESGTQSGDSIPHSKIYGWAFDGFPIYGPYGYTDGNDISSSVVRVTSGYMCMVDGDACSSDEEKAQPDNWVSDSSGMLDECNGRWTKTPEFPNGMYVYVLNVQENGIPEFPGVPYCLHGEATGSFSDEIENLMNEISKNQEKINALIAKIGGK